MSGSSGSSGYSRSVEAGDVALERSTSTFKVTVFRTSKTKQVLCVEADKEFVDTLFSFLLLPIGTIIHLTQGPGNQIKRLGGMSSIYGSVDPSILLVDKQELMQPRPSYLGCICERTGTLKFHQDLVAANILRSPLQKKLQFQPKKCPQGFVKENHKFIVTDKLEIMPSTLIASMSILKTFEVALVGEPVGTVTAVTVTQILQLLRSSLTSDTCLTDVFGPVEDQVYA